MAPGKRRLERRAHLLVLSNRLPYNLPKKAGSTRPKRNVGGLVNALEPVLAGGRGSWVGWDGNRSSSAETAGAAAATAATFRTETGVELHGVPLSDRELARFYHGFSNRTLWPLFHGLLDKAVFNAEDWTSYVKVNQRFAEITQRHVGDDARVWVHDYHLMLVPYELRERQFRGRVDFFLHIPFPPPEAFMALPWRNELIRGLLAADTVGFHVESYRDNFRRAVERMLDGSADCFEREGQLEIRHPQGTTLAVVAPIGVDVADFERLAEDPKVASHAETILQTHNRRKLLFCADRLDYTKGIMERMKAIERFLIKHPSRAGSFVFIQVVVPSRHQVDEYRLLKREIDEQVGRINGEFGRNGWNPIQYQYRALSRSDLVAHYLAASVALVTPLRDGMNLVAPEFVASRVDGDGVLLLSEFAGVAERLQEALQLNPYDQEAYADAIGLALDMPLAERAARMRGLRERVRANDLEEWVARCLGTGSVRAKRHPRALNSRRRMKSARSSPATRPFPQDPVHRLVARASNAASRPGAARTLLLDLDGTLAPIVPTPEEARVPSPTIAALTRLVAGRWRVAVVSGRAAEQIRALVPVHGVRFFGSHGLEGHWPGQQAADLERWQDHLEELAPRAAALASEFDGVRCERKPAGLVFHDRALSRSRLRLWHRRLEDWLADQGLNGLERIDGRRIVELRPRGMHKGLVVSSLPLQQGAPRPDDSLIAMGDDTTDEDMFVALEGRGLSIFVGGSTHHTAAVSRLPSPFSVQRFLSLLADRG